MPILRIAANKLACRAARSANIDGNQLNGAVLDKTAPDDFFEVLLRIWRGNILARSDLKELLPGR